MSYFAFLCRAAVSATSFTVVGNVSRVHPRRVYPLVHPLVHPPTHPRRVYPLVRSTRPPVVPSQ
jgi:hypothetical protein